VTPEALSSSTPAASQADRPEQNGTVAAVSGASVIIEAGKSSVSLGLRDFWAYRELLYFLTWRDVKVRYKQTLLGAAWAILQPLLTMLIFNLLFGRLAGIKTDGPPYPIFAYAGLVLWTFFANAVTNSGNSLVGSAHLITKIYFPRMIVPAGAVAAGLVDFALAFVVQIGLMIYYHIQPTWALLMIVPLVVLTTMLALGVGMWLSALNVKYRDVRYAVPFLIQLWMFVSPVIYPLSMVRGKLRWAVAVNPLTGIIQNFRAAVFANQPFDWKSLGISTTITVVILIYAAYSFRHMERRFADIV
jgi:lipopolysaccharide transport system permease protein